MWDLIPYAVVVQLLVVAFLFGKISSNITQLLNKSEKDSIKFGALFQKTEENKIAIAKNKTEIKNIKEDLKNVE